MANQLKPLKKINAALIDMMGSHILQLTFNIIAAVAPDGLMEWVKQGLHDANASNHPNLVIQDEYITLRTFY